MTNKKNQDDQNSISTNQNRQGGEDFEVSNQKQNSEGGEKTISVGQSDNDKEFGKTDQSITQAAPGQTATNTNQGGSNA